MANIDVQLIIAVATVTPDIISGTGKAILDLVFGPILAGETRSAFSGPFFSRSGESFEVRDWAEVAETRPQDIHFRAVGDLHNVYEMQI